MSGKPKRNSAASTYSASKKRRGREVTPSTADDQHGSQPNASPPANKSGKAAGKSGRKANGGKRAKDAESDGSSAEDEEVFEVATIKSHRKRKGVIEYRVGWNGYKSDDDSWEPADNLIDGALEILKQYRAAHHLDPITKSGRASDASAKTKRAAVPVESDGSAPEDSIKDRKRKRLSQDKPPSAVASLRKNGAGGPTKSDRDSAKNRNNRSESVPSDSESLTDEQWHARHKKLANWEDLIRSVRTVEKPEAEPAPAPVDVEGGSQHTRDKPDESINVCLLWNNGRSSWVSNKIAREKLPQKMLDFYEDHLQFTCTEQ